MVDDKQQRIETLQDRVDELEATVSKMLPSRRDALKLGAAGAVGAVGMAGSARAQNSNQVGTIGTESDRVDVNAEDIDAVSVNTDELFSRQPRDRAIIPIYYDGVSGDGTDSSPWTHSDGTAAIQKAIDKLEAGRQGKVKLPSGEYEITATPEVAAGATHVEGDIAGYNQGGPPTSEAFKGVKLDLASGVDGLHITNNNTYSSGGHNANSHISHLYVYGTGDQHGLAVPTGGETEQCKWTDLHVHSCQDGLYFDGLTDGGRIKDSSFIDNRDGIRFDANADLQFTRIQNCDISVNSRFPIVSDGGAGSGIVDISGCNILGNGDRMFLNQFFWTIRGCIIGGSSKSNIHLLGDRCTVIGNREITGASAHGIRVAGNYNQIIGNPIRDNRGRGVSVEGATGTTIALCGFDSNGGADIYIQSNSTDTRLWGIDGSISLTDNGTRTRWNGVIGAGPLGGVDLGTVSGQYVGDEAIADGTTNPAGKKYRWDGSSWNLIA